MGFQELKDVTSKQLSSYLKSKSKTFIKILHNSLGSGCIHITHNELAHTSLKTLINKTYIYLKIHDNYDLDSLEIWWFLVFQA